MCVVIILKLGAPPPSFANATRVLAPLSKIHPNRSEIGPRIYGLLMDMAVLCACVCCYAIYCFQLAPPAAQDVILILIYFYVNTIRRRARNINAV